MISRIPSALFNVFILLCAWLRSTALSALLYVSSRYSALLRASLRYSAPRYASLRYTALRYAYLRYTALRCTTLHYAALLRAIQGYPALFSTLFYSINCKLTRGRLDVKTDKGCDDPATYSE